MRPYDNPSELSPDQRRQAVANILAIALRRLRDRHALGPFSDPENPSKSLEKQLEDASETSVSGHVG
jgi:hypothetical protein